MSKWLRSYCIRTLVQGYEDGTFTESEVGAKAIDWLSKSLITEEDVQEIDEKIQAIKASREEARQIVENEAEEGE